MSVSKGVNFVKVFFYENSGIPLQRKQTLVALAYQTARDQQFAPKEILIRADLHNTTSNNGKHVKDPKGYHATLAFKVEDQVHREFHVASHGYTQDRDDFVLTETTHTPEKSDKTPRGRRGSGKVVWPNSDQLEEWQDSPVGYSHV